MVVIVAAALMSSLVVLFCYIPRNLLDLVLVDIPWPWLFPFFVLRI